MSLLWIKLKLIVNLGLVEVVIVILYRVMIKLGVHPVLHIKSDIPITPFFGKSRLPELGLASVSTWDDYGSLFSYINVPLGDQPPNWLANPITGDTSESKLSQWWKISDFDENTGDVKLIWERTGWRVILLI